VERTLGPASPCTWPKDFTQQLTMSSPPQLLHSFLLDSIEASVDHADLVHKRPPDVSRWRLCDACQVHIRGEVELQCGHGGVGLLDQVILQQYLRHTRQYAECYPNKNPRVGLHNCMPHVLHPVAILQPMFRIIAFYNLGLSEAVQCRTYHIVLDLQNIYKSWRQVRISGFQKLHKGVNPFDACRHLVKFR